MQPNGPTWMYLANYKFHIELEQFNVHLQRLWSLRFGPQIIYRYVKLIFALVMSCLPEKPYYICACHTRHPVELENLNLLVAVFLSSEHRFSSVFFLNSSCTHPRI